MKRFAILALLAFLVSIGCNKTSPTSPDIEIPHIASPLTSTQETTPSSQPTENPSENGEGGCEIIQIERAQSLQSIRTNELTFFATIYASATSGEKLYVRVWTPERHRTKVGDFSVNQEFSYKFKEPGTYPLRFDVEVDRDRDGNAEVQCDVLKSEVTVSLPPPPPPTCNEININLSADVVEETNASITYRFNSNVPGTFDRSEIQTFQKDLERTETVIFTADFKGLGCTAEITVEIPAILLPCLCVPLFSVIEVARTEDWITYLFRLSCGKIVEFDHGDRPTDDPEWVEPIVKFRDNGIEVSYKRITKRRDLTASGIVRANNCKDRSGSTVVHVPRC